MEEAMALAEKLANCGPKSQQGIIKLNRFLKGLSFEEAFKLEFEIALTILRSNDSAKGISAQKEKRKANFDD